MTSVRLIFIKGVLPFILLLLPLRIPAELKIVRNGESESVILLPKNPPEIDARAAARFQEYVKKISGAEIPVVESPVRGKTTVWIGSAGHVTGCPVKIAWDSLESDGFRLKTTRNALVIAGGTGKGALYGVYSFLEEYCGCRKFSPTVELIPKSSSIVLPAIDETQVPVIRYRLQNIDDPAYEEWHKLGNRRDDWGLFVHTFRTLVPPEKFFREHPEYFSLAKSGRIPDAQLCLSNPDVLRIVTGELQSRMNERPDARIWSVSQNDTFNPCACDSCRTLDSLEGSPSGSICRFVNAVADEFPGKTIATLAYSYSRKAPLTLVPKPNVRIVLCSIECNRSKPLDADPGSASFVEDIKAWSKLTHNIMIWDYVIDFRNMVSPFPNLRVLQPNMQFFVRNGIRSVFEQGYSDFHGEFAELRLYLLSKLLWNPYINVDSVMNDFLRGFYGNAAPYVRRYIDAMHDALAASGEDLLIYGYPLPSEKGYCSPGVMDVSSALFDSAEAAVAQEPAFLERVQTARLPLQFALLEQAKVYGTGARGIYQKNAAGRWLPKPEMTSLLDTFQVRCLRAGITKLWEGGNPPDEYAAATRSFLDSSMQAHRALFRQVALSPAASPKYHNGETSALTDGMRGWNDYHMHWLGFEGTDMDAVVDLGSVQPVVSVSTGFLQDINSWVFMPKSMEVLLSTDGLEFTSAGVVKNTIPADSGGAIVTRFGISSKGKQARYVMVKAEGVKICPDWHKGAGGLAWIFADEIVVR